MYDVLILKASYDDLSDPIKEIFQTFPLALTGKKILIKPNIVLGREPEAAATTHPLVVEAIIKECQRQGAKTIWVGDNSGGLPEWSGSAANMSGYGALSSEHFCDISQEFSFIDLDFPLVPPLKVSQKVLDADLIINVPKLKTHPLVGYTACIKNMFGVVVGLDKAKIHSIIRHPFRLAEFLSLLYKRFRPHLNIVDGILAMEGEGPSHGKPYKLGKLLAGYNGAMIDVVIASMLGMVPDGHPYYKFLQDNQLLPSLLTEISVHGPHERLDDFALPGLNTLNSAELRTLFKKNGPLKPDLEENKCVKCYKCLDVCLQQAITSDGYPEIDYERCIACWCCYEMCPEGAWVLPDPRQLIRK